MAKYSQITNCTDPALRVSEANLSAADALVDGELVSKGIGLDEVDPTHPALTLLAVFFASNLAAVEAQKGENSPMVAKAQAYERQAKEQSRRITRALLGIDTPGHGSGLGSIKIGRA